MILVVEGERASYSEIVERLDVAEVELATSVDEARDRLEASEPAAVVLTLPVEEAAPLIEDVRAGRFDRPGLPVVAATDGDADRALELGVDETVATPVSGATVEDAIERAVLLGRYKSAVHEFFDAYRERAAGSDAAGRSSQARRTADACLEEIQERDDSLAIEHLFQRI